MRVLFLTHNFPRVPDDAAGSFLLRLATALSRHDVEVRVVAPAGPGLAARERVDSIEVVRYRYAPAAHETLAYTGTMAADVSRSWSARFALGGMLLGGAAALRREVHAWKPDLVHAHWWFPSGLSASVPGARNGRPLVVTSHGSDVRLARGGSGGRALFRRVARRASTYTFVSRWLRDEARTIAGGDPSISVDTWEVAPMPVAAAVFLPPPVGAARDGMLFVGRLNEQKGLAELLHAMACQRHPRSLLVIADGPDADALRQLAITLGIADRVQWKSGVLTQSELAQRYAAAEVLVVPSREEGLGLVAAEAQLCETPVVAFASGGIPDVVRDGETGLLAPPSDVNAFAAALDRLAADPALARSLGTAGRRFALDHFTPDAVAARYRALYEHALSTGQRSATERS